MSDLLLPLLQGQLILFVLVLTRVSALILTAPFFSYASVPRRVRALLAITLSALITPLAGSPSPGLANSLTDLVILVSGELLYGAALGLALRWLFVGVQVAGQLISQTSGMALADAFDPGASASVPLFSHLLNYITLSIFILSGGHRMMLDAMLQLMQDYPPGAIFAGIETPTEIVEYLAEGFRLGIRAGTPIVLALLLSNLVLGLISRTLPQINVVAVGFGLNSLLTLSVLFIGMGAIAWTLQGDVGQAVERLVHALSP